MKKTITKKETEKVKKNVYIGTVGRRKEATARVRLYMFDKSQKEMLIADKTYKSGDIWINDQEISKYFPYFADKSVYLQPTLVTDFALPFAVTAYVKGGGKTTQKEAFSLAFARALQKFDYNLTTKLREFGLLTVDARVRERRKVGTGGKSRRQKQSPKR